MSAKDALMDTGPDGIPIPAPWAEASVARLHAFLPTNPQRADHHCPAASLHLRIPRACLRTPMSFPPPNSQATLSRTVFSVLSPFLETSTRQVSLVPWSWGLGVKVRAER